jgi:hypothetical protein
MLRFFGSKKAKNKFFTPRHMNNDNLPTISVVYSFYACSPLTRINFYENPSSVASMRHIAELNLSYVHFRTAPSIRAYAMIAIPVILFRMQLPPSCIIFWARVFPMPFERSSPILPILEISDATLYHLCKVQSQRISLKPMHMFLLIEHIQVWTFRVSCGISADSFSRSFMPLRDLCSPSLASLVTTQFHNSRKPHSPFVSSLNYYLSRSTYH